MVEGRDDMDGMDGMDGRVVVGMGGMEEVDRDGLDDMEEVGKEEDSCHLEPFDSHKDSIEEEHKHMTHHLEGKAHCRHLVDKDCSRVGIALVRLPSC